MHLGDVVTALPLAGVLKQRWPDVAVYFCGIGQARPLIECCVHIDGFIDVEAALADPAVLAAAGAGVFLNPYPSYPLMRSALAARIPIRVGNLRRPRMWRYCNRFVAYSRAHSCEHTVDIVLKNLRALKIRTRIADEDLRTVYGLSRLEAMPPELAALAAADRFNLIVHPKSGGEGREWSLSSFAALIDALPAERCRVIVTGVAAEREAVKRECPSLLTRANTVDLMGRLTLKQFIALAARMDGIVASGTGPLHIAAALGIHALGVYPPTANINALRWAPIGLQAESVGLACCPEQRRPSCLASQLGAPCGCMQDISPEQIAGIVQGWIKNARKAGHDLPASADRATP
ncbi:MAG: glycosyltransferase family 9 protein [Nevskiaceae bacterium]|nr:MAG: glycosyltransferase family 9 protein [Nevskiaceae bacterium]TBR72579.1 MAG: glycosyltransferase family 9 protein [Nevskiaceae bacterium]